jgi:hypothetical protein
LAFRETTNDRRALGQNCAFAWLAKPASKTTKAKQMLKAAKDTVTDREISMHVMAGCIMGQALQLALAPQRYPRLAAAVGNRIQAIEKWWTHQGSNLGPAD